MNFDKEYFEKHISEYFYFGYENKWKCNNSRALLLSNNIKLNCLVKNNKGFLDLEDKKFYMPFNIMILNNRDAPLIFYVCNKNLNYYYYFFVVLSHWNCCDWN